MLKLGILGNGTVGSGVVELVRKNAEYIKRRSGTEVVISKILVKDMDKHINNHNEEIITNNIQDVYSEDVDIVVEAMGGLHPAYEYIKSFLQQKKHVVTANKDVVAKYGRELAVLAEENNVSLRFEASVAGGIPILKPLQECLAGNDIKYLMAILNGTTNFILSKMYNESMKYEEALKIAQQLGFAEANPDSDVLGYDSARKLAILSSISYDEKVDWEDIGVQGITEIDDIDILCAKELNCTIKLLATSIKKEDGIYASVRPVLVPIYGYFGKIESEFNGILLEGDAVGQMFFCGKGAGKLPTASAVLGDIFDVIENKKQRSMLIGNKKAILKSKLSEKAKWLLRIKCQNTEEILSRVKESFKACESFENKDWLQNEAAMVVEAVNEEYIDGVVKELKLLPGVEHIKKLIKVDNI
jgi:homoserine dehydrogenase